MSLLLALTAAGGGVTVNATTQALVLTAYPASVTVATDVQSGTQALVLTAYPANIALDINVLATTQALVLTAYAATVDTSVAVEVLSTTQNLLLTQYQANVALDIDVNATAQEFVLTAYPATVEAAEHVTQQSSGGIEPYGGYRRKKRKLRDKEEEVRQERIRLGILPPDPVILPAREEKPAPKQQEPLSEIDAEIAALMMVALEKEDIAADLATILKLESEQKRLKRNRAISFLLLAA